MTFPAPSELVSPQINGAWPSFCDIQLGISTGLGVNLPGPLVNIEAIDYEDESKPVFFHMTAPYPVARGRSAYSGKGSITWGMEAYRIITSYLSGIGAGGFGDVRFTITVSYSSTQTSPIITDVLAGVRIGGNGQRNALGGKQIVTSSALSITQIAWGENVSASAILTLVGPSIA